MWRWRLPFDPTAIPHARRFARAATQVGSAQAGSVLDHDSAELVASELVTNAVIHGAPPVDLHVDTDNGHRVRVAVSDGDPSPIVAPARAAPAQEGGRGLAIVAAVSTRWGWVPTGHGKQVWCEIGPCPPVDT